MKIVPGTPALTVCQPWAWAIVAGGKDVENRTWPTRYRGPMLVHAGKSRTFLLSLNAAHYPGCPTVPREDSLVMGAVLAVVDLVGCVRDARSPWAERGSWHWQLENVRELKNYVPAQGAQGLWTPAPSIIEAVNEQLD